MDQIKYNNIIFDFNEFEIIVLEPLTENEFYLRTKFFWLETMYAQNFNFPLRHITKKLYNLESPWKLHKVSLLNIKDCAINVFALNKNYISLRNMDSPEFKENGSLVDLYELEKLLLCDENKNLYNDLITGVNIPSEINQNYHCFGAEELIKKIVNLQGLKEEFPEYFI